MADVTFTIAFQDDGTPVVKNLKREVDGIGPVTQRAGAQASGGLGAMERGARGAQQEIGRTRDALGRFVAGTQAATGEARVLSSALSNIGTIGGLLGLVVSAAALVKLLKEAVTAGVAYNATLEQQRIGIGSIIAATSQIADAQGKNLEGMAKFNAAQELSAALMVKIQEAALRTTATSEQLVDAFQAAVGPMKAAGLSLDQSLDATVKIVQAASAIGIPMHQVAQEVRAIAEGTIDQNARLANILEIGAKQVAQLKEQGKLYEFIVQKTQAFADAGKVTEQSFSGLASSIKDIVQQLLGLATQDFFKGMKESMGDVLEKLTKIRNLMAEEKKSGLERQIAFITTQLDNLEKRRIGGDTPGITESIIAKIVGSPADLEERIGGARTKLAELQEQLKALSPAAAGAKSALDAYTVSAAGAADGVKKLTPAQEALLKSFEKQIAGIKEHGETLNLSGKALADYQAKAVLAETGNKALSESMRAAVLIDEAAKDKKEALTKATHDAATAARKAAADAKKDAADKKKFLAELSKADEMQLRMAQDLAEIRKQEAKTNRVSLAQLEEEIKRMQEEGQVIAAGLGPKAELLALEKQIALAQTDRATALDLVAAAEDHLNEENKQAIVMLGEERKKVIEATAAQRAHTEALEDATLTTGDLRDIQHKMLETLLDTGSFKKSLDNLKDFGKDLGLRLIEGFALGKAKLEDEVLIPNFQDLFGQNGTVSGSMQNSGNDLGSLFGKFFGQAASSAVDSSFTSQNGGGIFSNVQAGSSSTAGSVGKSGFDLGSIFGQMFGAGAQSGMFSNVQASSSSTAASGGGGFMSMFSGLFGGTAGASSSGTAAGSAYGSAFGYAALVMLAVQAGKDFSKGKYGSGGGAIIGGAIGAYFSAGNPQITAAAAAVGRLIGSLFDPLFKQKPNLGTKIREATGKWLKEIGVSFAKEIDTADYFFEETKKLADKMFGGDFLAASRQVLNDKAGPEIAKQLQALGTAITSHQAMKLGKDVMQTGTTFGNMLLDNLGLDKIPEAIKEILEKSEISFEGLTKRLTELFDEEKVIDLEFYKDSIEGAVGLFFGELPEAIGASKLALQSFTDDNIFSLTTFQEKVKATTDQFGLIAQSFTDAVKNGKPGEEAAKLFGIQLKAGLEELAVDSFIQDFIDNKLFEGIDLSDGLDSTEILTLTERTRLASIAVDDLRTSLSNLGQGATELVDKIHALQATIQELVQQRIEIRLQLLDDFVTIGLTTALDAIAARIQSIQDQIENIMSRVGPDSRTDPPPLSTLTDADLTQLIQLNEQLRNAILSRYQEEAAAIQAAAQAQITAIRAEYAAKRADIQAEFAARRDAIQAEFAARRAAIEATIKQLQEQRTATQELYQAQIEAVQQQIEAEQEHIQALQEQLQIAEQFGQVVGSITDIIRSANVSAESPLDPQQQLGFLQREENTLRAQLVTATGAERARLMQELAQILQQQLQFADRNTVNGQQLFADIITELNALRAEAVKEADKAAGLQAQIAAATANIATLTEHIAEINAQMEVALQAIDAQIANQQALLSSLSAQEQAQLAALATQEQAQLAALAAQEEAAIHAVEATAAQQLTALRNETAAKLTALAIQQDLLVQEQLRRAEDQLAAAKEQLAAEVGTEEAARLLAAGDTAHLILIAASNTLLFNIDQHIVDLLNNNPEETQSQTSASPQQQRVSSTGTAAVPALSFSFTFAPAVTLTMQGGEEQPEQTARLKAELENTLRLSEQRIKRLVQTDWVPMIRRGVEGKM